MRARAFLLPAPLAMLLACGSGSTMSVAKGEGTTGEPAVSLAPAPETTTSPTAQPNEPRQSTDTVAPKSVEAPASQEQGYAPYGSGNDLDIRRIGQWTRTGINEARRLVIRDANTWSAFWSELGVGERPAVDFTRDIAVAVATGQRPSGGYEIAVSRIRQADGALTIEVTETAPGPNCMTAATLTQPVDLVVIPAQGVRNWTFAERKEVRGCR